MNEDTPYVNINKVADYFQVSVSTVRKWVNNDYIPDNTYIKIGEVYRFRLDDVESCLLYTSPSPRDRTRSRMPSTA